MNSTGEDKTIWFHKVPMVETDQLYAEEQIIEFSNKNASEDENRFKRYQSIMDYN